MSDMEVHSGLFKEYLCGDVQVIYILHVIAHEVVVHWYTRYPAGYY